MSGLLLIALVISLAANVWLLKRVLLPVRRLTARARRVADGDFTALQYECGGIADIDVLRRVIRGLIGHVRRAQEQSHVYTDALTRGQEAERSRIAHELHDETVQSLIATGQYVDMASDWIESGETERASNMLTTARQQITGTVASLRNLIADLRPPALEELGLIPALQMLEKRFPDLELTINVRGVQRRLQPSQELALFRCAQEGLNNAQRHGEARSATITIKYQPDTIEMIVEDDGKGFTLPETLDDLAEQGHYGLVGIQERVQHLGGTMRIKSTPGSGTRLKVTLPAEQAPQPADAVRDPVCSALIQPQQAYGSIEYQGKRYYFCCPVCQGTFQRNPELYLS